MSVMTSAAVPLPMPKKSWSAARKLLVGLLGAILILAFLTLSLSPAVETAAPPASADVIAARAAFDRVRAQAGTGKPVPTFISWREARVDVARGNVSVQFKTDISKGLLKHSGMTARAQHYQPHRFEHLALISFFTGLLMLS